MVSLKLLIFNLNSSVRCTYLNDIVYFFITANCQSKLKAIYDYIPKTFSWQPFQSTRFQKEEKNGSIVAFTRVRRLDRIGKFRSQIMLLAFDEKSSKSQWGWPLDDFIHSRATSRRVFRPTICNSGRERSNRTRPSTRR